MWRANGGLTLQTLLDVSNPTEAKSLVEAELSREEDSPMSLCALSGGRVAVGINAGQKIVKDTSGSGNLHFRVFKHEGAGGADEEKPFLREVFRKAVFRPDVLKEEETYQRLCRGRGGIIVVGSGGGKKVQNELIVLRDKQGDEWNIMQKITSEGGKEVADVDVDVNRDGEPRTIGWCLPQGIYTTPFISTNASMLSPTPIYTLAPNSGSFRSLRFIGHSTSKPVRRLIATTVNLPSRTGAQLIILSVPTLGPDSISSELTSCQVLSRRPLHRNIRATTSMDLISLPPTTNSRGELQGQTVVAISGADISIEILVVDYPLGSAELKDGDIRVRTLKTFYDVHPFQITRVVWSKPVRNRSVYELKLATVSIGQTVVTYTIPIVTVQSPSPGACTSATASLFNPSLPSTPSAELSKSGNKKKYPGETDTMTELGMYVLPPPGTRRATIYSVTVSLGLVIFLAILLQLVFVYRGGLLVGVDARQQESEEGERRRDGNVRHIMQGAAEVAGEWVVEGGRNVAGGVVKGMVRGAVEQGVRGVLGG